MNWKKRSRRCLRLTMCKYLLLIFIVGCGCSGSLFAFDLTPRKDWDYYDTALFVCAIAANGADMYTTNKIIKDGGWERNTIMPKYPSGSRLLLHWIVASAGEYFIANNLPSSWRKVFLFSFTVEGAYYARKNYITCNWAF